MTTTPDNPVGTSLSGGRYVLTAKLGEGGMGVVYRAKDRNIDADVVIKLPHRAMVADAQISRRFREEWRALVRLSHPHIVKVTDVGEWDGIPFVVLQYLAGGSLEDRMAAWRGPIALATLGSWLGPIGAALDYVHSQKLVHRDVKPANILFDGQGHPFLGDFGVVKVLAAAADDRTGAASMTGAGMVLGTPYYMAPELIMGDPFDGRVDQYALVVTLYESPVRAPAVRARRPDPGPDDADPRRAARSPRALRLDSVPSGRRSAQGARQEPQGPLSVLRVVRQRRGRGVGRRRVGPIGKAAVEMYVV